MTGPTASIRTKVFGAAAAAALDFSASTAFGQSAKLPVGSQPKGVAPAACSVFGTYLVEEVKVAINDVRREFLLDAGRFVKSGCTSRDADGKIELITRTNEDGRALLTTRRRMGTIDVLGDSGVVRCHRPEGGNCTTRAVMLSAPASVSFLSPLAAGVSGFLPASATRSSPEV